VLDVGCGTGILSMFAAKAGAAKVICVEFTAIASVTEQLVRANGMDGVVTVIQGAMEDVDIGVENGSLCLPSHPSPPLEVQTPPCPLPSFHLAPPPPPSAHLTSVPYPEPPNCLQWM
jgi:predicted RNA methylase